MNFSVFCLIMYNVDYQSLFGEYLLEVSATRIQPANCHRPRYPPPPTPRSHTEDDNNPERMTQKLKQFAAVHS